MQSYALSARLHMTNVIYECFLNVFKVIFLVDISLT